MLKVHRVYKKPTITDVTNPTSLTLIKNIYETMEIGHNNHSQKPYFLLTPKMTLLDKREYLSNISTLCEFIQDMNTRFDQIIVNSGCESNWISLPRIYQEHKASRVNFILNKQEDNSTWEVNNEGLRNQFSFKEEKATDGWIFVNKKPINVDENYYLGFNDFIDKSSKESNNPSSKKQTNESHQFRYSTGFLY